MVKILLLCLFSFCSLDAGNVGSGPTDGEVKGAVDAGLNRAIDSGFGLGGALADLLIPVLSSIGEEEEAMDEAFKTNNAHTSWRYGENDLHRRARIGFKNEKVLIRDFKNGGLKVRQDRVDPPPSYYLYDVHKRNKAGWTPLHVAAEYGRTMEAKVFLDYGAEINEGDNKGNTPLHFAYKNKRTEMVALLIERGADETLTNNEGKLPSQMG